MIFLFFVQAAVTATPPARKNNTRAPRKKHLKSKSITGTNAKERNCPDKMYLKATSLKKIVASKATTPEPRWKDTAIFVLDQAQLSVSSSGESLASGMFWDSILPDSLRNKNLKYFKHDMDRIWLEE